ncbi:kinase-like domain-containing protein [Glomus cerebriforme]|uniref:Kinase-like domain-containing protein n=1 Tax=Glomus cerebriforme TaxID=658196 RepID=A0A397SAN4_9GLOM|nr:kinase-like domain-containing protein [Glomus cerebriforme]
MTDNKIIDTDEWIQWIKDGIGKEYINYHYYNEFQNINCVGTGKFRKVYQVNWTSLNTIVALKFLESSNFMKEIFNELKLLHKVNFHTNIIQFFGITERKSNAGSSYSCLFLNMQDNGTLRDYLKIISQIHRNTIKLADFGLSRRTDVSSSVEEIFEMIPYIDPQYFKK